MKRLSAVLALAFSLYGVGDAAAKTWVVPHVFDTSGTASAGEFDSYIFFTHNGGIADIVGTGMGSVDVYLFDDNGQTLVDVGGGDLCAPCSFNLSTSDRTEEANFQNILGNANAFPPSGVFTGFAVVTVEGAEAEAVGIQSFIANFQSSPVNVSVLGFEPQVIQPVSTATTSPAFSYVHAIESDQLAGVAGAYDTNLQMVYAGGRATVPSGAGATVDVYVYDEATSLPAQGGSGDVCNPCTYAIGVANPKESLSLHNAFVAAGGFVSPIHTLTIVVAISGDLGLVATSCQTINSEGPNLYNMWPLFTNDHPTGPASAVGPGGVPLAPGLRSVPNPFNPATTIEYRVVDNGPVRIDVVDVRGHIVATLADRWMQAGIYTARWNGRGEKGEALSSGVYFARMSSSTGTRTLKMTLLK